MAIGKPIRPDGHFALLSDQGDRYALENRPSKVSCKHFVVPSTMSPHAHLARSPVGLADKVWLEAVGREPGENSPWYRSHVLAQRPKLASETLIPQEWLNLALSDATAAAGLGDLAMHSCPGKMSGLEYQLAILTDVVETPSDASDHGSFPVASAWPKLPPLAPEKRGSPLRPTSGSRRAVPMYPRARVLLPGLRSPINRVSEASASILIGRAHIKLVVSHTRQRYPP